MKNEIIKHEGKIKREQMIELIVKVIKQVDDRKLRNIYNFVIHIQ